MSFDDHQGRSQAARLRSAGGAVGHRGAPADCAPGADRRQPPAVALRRRHRSGQAPRHRRSVSKGWAVHLTSRTAAPNATTMTRPGGRCSGGLGDSAQYLADNLSARRFPDPVLRRTDRWAAGERSRPAPGDCLGPSGVSCSPCVSPGSARRGRSLQMVMNARSPRLSASLTSSSRKEALIPVAYARGTDFKPAHREPLANVVHWDSW